MGQFESFWINLCHFGFLVLKLMKKRTQKLTAEAVWDSDTIALLSSECSGIESEQGSGFERDAVLYTASALSGKAITPAGHIRQNIYMPGLFLTHPNLF